MSGATILRKRVRSGFTQVPNETIRDGGLSFKAVGVLVHMLSLPDGAKISADQLAEAHREGRSAILSALQELRDGGYYRFVPSRRLECERYDRLLPASQAGDASLRLRCSAWTYCM
jgi:hypothetical protein